MSEIPLQTTGANILNPETLEPTGQTVGEKPAHQEELQDAAEYKYKPYGLDQIDLDEIKIDTQEGRYNFLTSLVDNALAFNSERLEVLENGSLDNIRNAEPDFRDLNSSEVDSLEEETRRYLDLINAQKSILENLDFSNLSVIQALKSQSEQYHKKSIAEGISEAAAMKFQLMHEAANNLYMIMVDEVKQRKQQNESVEVDAQEEIVNSIPSQEAIKDVPIPESEINPAASYNIEGGLLDAPITLAVGQEIPNDWFDSKNVGEKNDSGFGITIERPAPIKNYLKSILNIEYEKIDDGERQYYDYSSISNKIIEEAQRTKKIPDVATILRSSDNRKK